MILGRFFPSRITSIFKGNQFSLERNMSFKATNMSVKKYDLVIYGASGFTGQFVIEEVARVASLEQKNGQLLTWAVAGRNKEKLLATLADSSKYVGQNLDNIDIVQADNSDEESLAKMAAQAKVVINCVGPYQLYGEPVVKACIENGANHVDISGESNYMQEMQLKYDSAAESAGVHIVGACGFDSVPADVGLAWMIKNFPGEICNCIYIASVKGPTTIHTGTLESALLAVANRSEMKKIWRQLYPKPMPPARARRFRRGFLFKEDDANIWCVQLPTDEPVVDRTQRYLYESRNMPAVQFQAMLGKKKYFEALFIAFGMLYIGFMSMFSVTRALLRRFPEVLTAGTFSRAGPSRENLKKVSFKSTFVAHGWTNFNKLRNPNSLMPNVRIIAEVSGPDPGYGATSIMVVASAMTILREKEVCERKGGVMTPGAAFYETNMVRRLTERGISFTMEENTYI